MKTLIILPLLALAPFLGYPQEITENQNLKHSNDTLTEVTVGVELKTRSTPPNTEKAYIWAAKKAEFIRPSASEANLALNNTRQIFARVPGVHIWENDGSGIQIGVSVRGLSPNRSWEFNTRQNGVDISSDPFGYPEAYYNPPMEAVEEIRIVRGASSIQFGSQFGGLLDYRIKQGGPKVIQGESRQTFGAYGLFNSFNAVGGTYKKLNYYSYVNYRTSEGWRENSAYRLFNAYSSLKYQFNSKLKAGVEASYMNFSNQQAGGLTDSMFREDPRQSVRPRNWFSTPWFIPAVNLTYQKDSSFVIDLKAFGLIGERKSLGFTPSGSILIPDTISRLTGAYAARQVDIDEYRNVGTELRIRKDYGLLGNKHSVSFGARYFYGNTRRKQSGRGTTAFDEDYSVSNPFPRSLNFETQNFALFAENLAHISNSLLVTFGMRYEYLNSIASGRMGVTPSGETRLPGGNTSRNIFLYSAGFQWSVLEKIALYGNFARAYRPVLYSDLTPSVTTLVIDQNLQDANGFNADLGWKGERGRLIWDMNLFWLQYNNRIGILSMSDQDGTYLYRTNVGSSSSKGVEAYGEALLAGNLRGIHNRLSLFSSLTLMEAVYTEGSFVSNNQNQELKGKNVENAPAVISRSGLKLALKRFQFTWQTSYVSKTYADAQNTEFASNGKNGAIPAFWLSDLSGSCRLNNTLNLSGGVNNLFDKSYFTRRATGYPGPGIIPADGRIWYVTVTGLF